MSTTIGSSNLETFHRNMIEVYGGKGAAWLEQLPGLIRKFEQRWSIKAGDPFLLSFNYCASALHDNGQELVLKLGVPNEDFTQQIHALRAFNGHGMVRLIDADIEQGAMLLERLKPGQMLVDVVQDDEMATSIAAELMLSMWVPPPQDHHLPNQSGWAADFKQIEDHFDGQTCPMDRVTVQRTIALFSDLLASPTQPFLIHGDLHHFNILSVSSEEGTGWRAIDPFGVIGDREADVGALMKNPNLEEPIGPDLCKMLIRRFTILQEVLGFDLQRMVAWASVYAALSSWWSLSAGSRDWKATADLSDFFASLL